MRRGTREWSVPVPFRALTWWPAVSFVIGIATPPDAAVVAIVVAGIVLALTDVLIHAVGSRWRRHPISTLPPRSEPVEFDAAA
ncbi:MAG: hypothetical protein L0H84_21345 [Pseudonocardia sp.]|nr:hypothetical protein [Pseudonocardia sp.]